MNGIKVLIVDSNAELRTLMSRFLQLHLEISTLIEASDGNDALTILAHKKVDIILLEIILPGMDGFKFIEKLLEMQLDPMPQIIVTSSLRRKDFILRAYSLGVKEYLIKPFGTDELLTSILKLKYSTNQAKHMVF